MGRVLRNDPDLHKFEIAQLGSLCPEEAEEAKTLIPRSVNSTVQRAHLPVWRMLILVFQSGIEKVGRGITTHSKRIKRLTKISVRRWPDHLPRGFTLNFG